MAATAFLLFVLAAAALMVQGIPAPAPAPAPAEEQEQYPSRLDLIDVDTILSNDRLAESYFKCLMDQGRCTQEGTELKKRLPEALQNNCAKCSSAQRKNVEKAIAFLSEKRKDHWKQLLAKYDPEGKWLANYEEQQKKQGVPPANA